MRTAGLPTFRKLFYRNDGETLRAGRYSIQIFMSERVFPPFPLSPVLLLPPSLLFPPPRSTALTVLSLTRLEKTTPSSRSTARSRSSSRPCRGSEARTRSSAGPTSRRPPCSSSSPWPAPRGTSSSPGPSLSPSSASGRGREVLIHLRPAQAPWRHESPLVEPAERHQHGRHALIVPSPCALGIVLRARQEANCRNLAAFSLSCCFLSVSTIGDRSVLASFHSLNGEALWASRGTRGGAILVGMSREAKGHG